MYGRAFILHCIMSDNHNWSAEIYEIQPGKSNTPVKAPIEITVYVAEREEGETDTHFLLSLDPHCRKGSPYNLNRRHISVKLTETKDGAVSKEWSSDFFAVDRTSPFRDMLVGVLDGFDEEELLMDSLRKKDVRCVSVDSTVTVCTRPWKPECTCTHGAAISIQIPDTVFPPQRPRSPVFDRPRSSVATRPAKSQKRARDPNRQGKMAKARRLARLAPVAPTYQKFSEHQHEAVSLASQRVNDLRDQLKKAESELRTFERLRFKNDRSHSPPEDTRRFKRPRIDDRRPYRSPARENIRASISNPYRYGRRK